MDYLCREDAPFTAEQWEQIDETVVCAARQVLIGRRFIPIYGPLGAGFDHLVIEGFNGGGDAETGFAGDDDAAAVTLQQRRHLELPMVYKDFSLLWRDLENAKQFHLPFDFSAAASAAALCARKEDDLIFNGHKGLGYEGLLTAGGSQRMVKGNWSEESGAFHDVVRGIEGLVAKGFSSQWVLVVSPDLYAQMQRIQPQLGILELERVKSLVDGGVFQTPAMGRERAVLVSSEPRNLDLAIGQDLVTAYLGPDKLNHQLRVMETVMLRIKNPEAIVVFEAKQ
jgi:uncharacterized linocin/CFP29 family protein